MVANIDMPDSNGEQLLYCMYYELAGRTANLERVKVSAKYLGLNLLKSYEPKVKAAS